MFNFGPIGELRLWRGIAALSVAAVAALVYLYVRLHSEPEDLVSRKCEPELSASAQEIVSALTLADAQGLPLRQSLGLARVPRMPVELQAVQAQIAASAAAQPSR